ncbi:hypothetical protein MANES_04G113050v8 [Manihot esculenta]|uniref:Uncharacterized protein n=1 Tax=Manihot esculenta TaxID=3983 RepID=A0ACB7HUG2_MANES|nr:hypothetical protein MANES_04G113050v8 [Manihot esculenta]
MNGGLNPSMDLPLMVLVRPLKVNLFLHMLDKRLMFWTPNINVFRESRWIEAKKFLRKILYWLLLILLNT